MSRGYTAKVPANWSSDVLDLVNSFEIEGATIYFDDANKFSAEDLDIISGEAIVKSLSYDRDFSGEGDMPDGLYEYKAESQRLGSVFKDLAGCIDGTQNYCLSYEDFDDIDKDYLSDWIVDNVSSGDDALPLSNVKSGDDIFKNTWGNDPDYKMSERYSWSKTRCGSITSSGRASAMSSNTAKLPMTSGGVQGSSTAPSMREYSDQLFADSRFLSQRMQYISKAVTAYEELEDLDDEAVEEGMDRLAELQEKEEDGDLTPEEAEELARLQGAMTPSNLSDRADQQAAVAALEESGEAGSYAAAMRAMEQCFMIKDIVTMAQANVQRSREGKTQYRVADGPAAHMVHGEMGQTVSKLMFDPAYSAYYFMPPSKLSYLTPSIKLYQVLHEANASGPSPETSDLNPPVDFQIPFFQHMTQYSIDQIMNGEEGRGGIIGLKSFDWVYQGSNPASSRRDIKATLILECQSFGELVRERTVTLQGPNGEFTHHWTYADLAIRRNRDHRQAPDVIYQQTKVVVGWGLDDASEEINTLGFTEDEIRAVKNSQMTMFLTLIDHGFDIREDGTVEMKIEYRAYIEGAFTSPEANVLITDDLLEKQAERKRLLGEMQADINDPNGRCRTADLQELKRRFTNQIHEEKEQAHLSLLKGLEDENSIFIRTIDIVEMMQFMQNPFAGSSGANAQTGASGNPSVSGNSSADQLRTADGVVADLESKFNFPDQAAHGSAESQSTNELLENVYTEEVDGEFQVPYFFLGDLIHVALKNISKSDTADPKKFKNMRLLLGALEINDFENSDVKYQINIADVPIAVTYFLEWFMNRIQKKQEVVWYLMDFIKDVIKNMIYKVLNSDECFAGAVRQKANFQNIYLVGKGNGGVDKIQELIDTPAGADTGLYKRLFVDDVSSDQSPILEVDKSDEQIDAADMFHYVLLYAADPTPRNLNGNFSEDVEKGVYHFHIGTNKGLVKRIKFTKTDQPGLREARYFSQGYDGLSQLREPYKIDIEMYGNARIFPGQTIYVDPQGLGFNLGSPANEGSMAWTLGLGGYHMVINVQHTIARGIFDTRVNAVWVLRGGMGGESTEADGTETPARNTSACQVLNNSGLPASGYDPSSEGGG